MSVIADNAPAPHALPVRHVVLFAFPGVQSLDVTGPLEVFAAARDTTVEVAAPAAGAFRTSSGLTLVAERSLGDVADAAEHAPSEAAGPPIDTFVIAGGDGTPAVAADHAILAAVRRVAARSRRVASVCSGAFVLAEAGLLDGRRATTHWRSCGLLARRYPTVTVDPDAIFVRDGNVWTSAGVTAGIDLALAMLEEDVGRDTALRVARRLVVFLKRPGGQSQFSAQLAGQLAQHEPLRDLQAWIVEHPDAGLTVEALAARVAMSPRNFSRVFAREAGATPARFVEQVRVEAARRLLEESNASTDEIATRCGFGTAETMRRAFLRTLRTSPREYRNRFRDTRDHTTSLEESA
jgi:transcriptional regulator GlxA family with amidase domain